MRSNPELSYFRMHTGDEVPIKDYLNGCDLIWFSVTLSTLWSACLPDRASRRSAIDCVPGTFGKPFHAPEPPWRQGCVARWPKQLTRRSSHMLEHRSGTKKENGR